MHEARYFIIKKCSPFYKYNLSFTYMCNKNKNIFMIKDRVKYNYIEHRRIIGRKGGQ